MLSFKLYKYIGIFWEVTDDKVCLSTYASDADLCVSFNYLPSITKTLIYS